MGACIGVTLVVCIVVVAHYIREQPGRGVLQREVCTSLKVVMEVRTMHDARVYAHIGVHVCVLV